MRMPNLRVDRFDRLPGAGSTAPATRLLRSLLQSACGLLQASPSGSTGWRGGLRSHQLWSVLLFSLLLGSAALGQESDETWHQEREAAAQRQFDALMGANLRQEAARPTPAPASAAGAQATVPLDRYEEVVGELDLILAAATADRPPPVVLGAATYTGRSVRGALSLHLSLVVTLEGEGSWKSVPLVGQEAVITSARVDGQDLPLSVAEGYHVWPTTRAGDLSVEVDLLLPSRGPRGSLEYELLVPRTPVTRFSCLFPEAGLQPRLRGAVQSTAEDRADGTLVSATLAPTERLHLVGFRDVSAEDQAEARVYAESAHLVSVDSGVVDLFTVVRYHILHAPTRSFDLALPEGADVISADGEGGLSWRLETDEDGRTLLRGETAYPIRSRYEISLRTRRELDGAAVDLELPEALGVERETGWLGVEVPGNLAVEELSRGGVLSVDVRQLPPELVHSAVSPLVAAYRYHGAESTVRLGLSTLPEQEPASASVDSVVATTVISAEGEVLTDMRLSLRNRLRHGLALTLPEGASVRSTLVDGEPVRPGRGEAGELILPLKRSRGTDRLEPFTVQVVLAHAPEHLGLAGRAGLELPAVDLPVSSLAWTVYVPPGHRTSGLRSEVEAQRFVRTARWFQPSYPDGAPRAPVAPAVDAVGAGAMPVRIDLPTAGRELSWKRYWVEAGEPARVHLWHAHRAVVAPVMLGLAGLLGLLGLGVSLRPRGRRVYPLAVATVLSLGLAWLAGAWTLGVLALVGGLGLGWLLHRPWRRWRATESQQAPDSESLPLSELLTLRTPQLLVLAVLGFVALVQGLRVVAWVL